MKLNKKTVTILSFTLGTTLFLSTAFADAMIGSGYDRLKSSIKNTAAQMEHDVTNYTSDMMFTLKDNGEVFIQSSKREKVDLAAKAAESTAISQYGGDEPIQTYSYHDATRNIWKDPSDGTYTVFEQENAQDWQVFRDPFKEPGAAEMEKIFDAVVGNLKDYVQADEREDGGKIYSGSLSEAQVPALVNAVASFGMKQLLSEESRSNRVVTVPQIENDIYVKKVTGIATESKSGLLENMTGEVVLSGKDKDGHVHDLSISLVFRLIDVGQTRIVLPDLTGAVIQKANDRLFGLSSKYVGTYKNDIVLEKNGQFVKAGERRLEITAVHDGKLSGKYSETINPGFQAELGDPLSFTFEQPLDVKEGPMFTYTAANGEKGVFHLYPNDNGQLFMDMDYTGPARNRKIPYDRNFIRLFE